MGFLTIQELKITRGLPRQLKH